MSPLPLVILTLAAPQVDVPTGPQLLRRSDVAYRSAKTFEQEVAGTIGGQHGTAHVWFARPGKMRVVGTDFFGSRYELLSVGKKTWLQTGYGWDERKDWEKGVESITYMSAHAGTYVPAVLGDLRVSFSKRLRKASTKVIRTKLGGKDAYLLSSSKPFAKIWFDPKTAYYVRAEIRDGRSTVVVDFKPPKVNGVIPANRFKK